MTRSRWTPPLLLSALALAGGCKAPQSAQSPQLRADRGVAAEASAAPAGPAREAESITNTQEAEVDEGGIVKTHGDHLVVLRRGRLFTVRVADGALRPVAYVDVTPSHRHDAWYDELLVHGDTVVVVGYSYRLSATELALFRIDDAGGLRWVDTYFLDSNDYYSSRNYASRLIGDQLVFYMPHYVGEATEGADAADQPLRLGRWKGSARRTRKRGDWDRLMDGAELVPSIESGPTPMLHTVITCDLSAPRLGCRARGVRGSYGRSFYVSADAVYVWTHPEGWYFGYVDYADPTDAPIPGALYRLPLRGGPIGAVQVDGAPVDQFSFKESADGHLNVLVHGQTPGDAMWGPEQTEPTPDVGLLRMPLAAFDQRGGRPPEGSYRDLPDVQGPGYAFVNRFVGDALLYGQGSGWGYAAQADRSPLYVHHYTEGQPRTHRLQLSHGVDRIEALGDDGLVVGSDGEDLRFTSLRLGTRPAIAGQFIQPHAYQGELRSHGFFFRSTGEGTGLVGLPLRSWNSPGYAHLYRGSSRILYLGVDDLRFSELGTLDSRPDAGAYDACITSCTDWYGNARPIFYRGRVFALMGYELVEGRVVGGTLEELRRVDMTSIIGDTALHHVG